MIPARKKNDMTAPTSLGFYNSVVMSHRVKPTNSHIHKSSAFKSSAHVLKYIPPIHLPLTRTQSHRTIGPPI
ncbi:predicted protein [Plenodomus lingam JN3]|uniref:Predicted protein n=1 Tax=Leptosphaeria maculans (strain JN3 / isolate v23.1.3 / race Av1-4-5-6-7-8) TaxID=985895 RepID=E5R572_LEPMJ|nr:predicted protein [Plenodomus lingam JN3]CBX92042.1 predicted protein [Plenodomus lingam JN3]